MKKRRGREKGGREREKKMLRLVAACISLCAADCLDIIVIRMHKKKNVLHFANSVFEKVRKKKKRREERKKFQRGRTKLVMFRR